MTNNEKLKYIKDANKNGKVAIKVKAIGLSDEECNGKIYYLRIGNLRGRKAFYNTPYFKHIGNDWKAISFYMSNPIKDLMSVFEIIDEEVVEMSREDAIEVLGYDTSDTNNVSEY